MPVRTGTASQVDISANTGSTSVTVPADATGVIVFVSWWELGPGTSDLTTLTLGGTPITDQLSVASGASVNGYFIGSLFALPGTGSQTLAWAYTGGTGNRDEGGECVLVWVKGTKVGDEMRDVDGIVTAGLSNISLTLDTQPGDLLLQFAESFSPQAPGPDGTLFITNATLNSNTYSVSEVTPSGGSTTTLNMSGEDDSTMLAASLKALPQWTKEQAVSGNSNVSDPTIAFPSNVKAGSLLVVGVDQDHTGTAVVSDTRGNVWTPIRSTTTVNGQMVYWYYAISKDAGACTITCGGVPFIGYSIAEYSTIQIGTIVLDVENTVYRSTTGAGTDKFNTASVTASLANSLAVSFLGTDTNTNADLAAGTSCVLDTQGALSGAATNDRVAIEHKEVSAGSVTLPWSTTGNFDGQVHIAVFKVAAPSAAPPPELFGGYSPPNFGWRGLSQEQFRDIAIPQWSGLVDNQRMRKRAIRYEDINEVAYFAPAPLPITSVDYPDSATVTISIQVQGPDGAADNFNRSDSADLGPNWTPIFGETAYTISSGLARPSNYSNFNNAEVYTGMSWSPDQYSECIIINPHGSAGAGAGIGVVVRGSTSETTYYGFVCNANASNGWTLFKYVADTGSTIASGTTAFAHADVVRLEVIGTTLKVYRNGVLFTTATDSSIVDGSPGIVLAPFSFDSMNENWSGGSISVDTLQAVDSATVNIDIQVSTTVPSVIAVDQINIGELSDAGSVVATSVLTTTQTVAPNALIVLTANWYTTGSAVLSGVSGGGLTWTIDQHLESVAGECAAMISAPAPAGLPSGTAITFTYSDTSATDRLMAGSSFLGMNLTANRINRSNAFIPVYTTNWSAPVLTTDVPTLVVGMATSAGNGNPTSTPDSGEVEAHDFHNSSGQHSQVVNYEIATTPGFHQPSGAWSSDQSATGDKKAISVAYCAADYSTQTFTIAGVGDDGSGWWSDTTPYTWPPAETWNDDTGTTALYTGKGQSGTSYQYANNSFYRWDTSALPDSPSVVAAVFRPYLSGGVANFAGYSFTGDYYDFGGEPTVSADGIIQLAGTSIWTPVSATTLAGTGSGFIDFKLNDLSGINKTGYTGIRTTLDEGGSVISGTETQILMEPYEHFGATRAAQLIVSYYIPVSGPVDIFLPVDSATVLVDIQVDTTEVYTPGGGGTLYTDAATPLVDIQASGTELREVTDSATVLVDIQVASTEQRESTDAVEIYVDIQSSGTELRESTDAATVLYDIQTSATEAREVTDAATVLVDIQSSGTEIREYSDAATIPILLSPTGTEFRETTDTATVPIDIDCTSAELREVTDSATTIVDIQVATTDVADWIDANTCTVVISPTTSDIAQFIDTAETYVDIQASGSELQEHSLVDSDTTLVDIQVATSDIAIWIDSATTPVLITVATSDIAVFVDSAEAYYDIQITSTEAREVTDTASVYYDIQVATTELREVTDSDTVLVDINTSATEQRESTDSASVYYDIQTTATELREVTDTAEVYYDIQVTTVLELREVTDTGTVTVIISLTSTDTADFSDTAQVYYDIQSSGTETTTADKTDSDTVLVDIQSSDVQLFAGIDANTVVVVIVPSASDILTATDANQVYVDITLSSVDTYDYSDTAQAYVDIQITTTEQREVTDTNTVPIAFTITSADILSAIEAASIYVDIIASGIDTLGASNQYTDAATISYDIQTSDVQEFAGVDANTVLVDIQPTTVDEFLPVDSAQVYYDITTTGVEVSPLSDSAVVPLVLTPATSDTLTAVDAFVVYIDIQPSTFEFQIIPSLVGIFYVVAWAPRWQITAEARWQAVGIMPRWRLDKSLMRWFYWAAAPRMTRR